MINYVGNIAVKDNEKRREFIIEKLRELNCPYHIQYEKVRDVWIQNIIVKFRPGSPKVVLGSHYDSFEGSTGANDNSTGVCILLNLIEEYIKKPQTVPMIPLEVVFFDCEEIGLLGSNAYLFRVKPDDILAMINLDSCGVGDSIVIAPAKNLENTILGKVITSVENLGKHNVKVINELLTGDEYAFETRKIPNIVACTLESNDIECMIQATSSEEKEPEKSPAILETMHNGSRDSIDVVEESAMEMTFKWIKDVIENFKK